MTGAGVTGAARRDRLRAVFAALDVDAVLVTSLVNVRYLTGFTGSNAALLLARDDSAPALLATDGRYTTQAAAEVPDVDLLIDRATAVRLTARAAEMGVRRLAFEAHAVTVEQYGDLTAVAPDTRLVPLGRAVERLREVKDDEEIALLRQACAITEQALADVWATIAPGRTERDLAAALEARMRARGADGPAFDTIVAAGPHSAVPHHRPTDRPVSRGDLLKIDLGARCAGYHADMTRTVVVGGPPTGWQREIHDLVAAAQAAGRSALAPGAEVRAVDAAAREVIAAGGHGTHFPHGLGHGVGLEIHEAPLLGPTATGILQDCTPVTVEPGVYLPGRGGVRIEDTLVVRAGGAEPLTTTTRDLLVL